MLTKLSARKYFYKTWKEYFGKNMIDLKKLYIHNSWKSFFDMEIKKPYWEIIEKYLKQNIKDSKAIFPYPELVFNSFNYTNLNDINVVILGQDPYHGYEVHQGIYIPQAVGLSFSVPEHFKIPSSLKNIYKNLLKHQHIDETPTSGNLEFWAYQGCLMLNATLTVEYKSPNSHQKIWRQFSDNVIKYISRSCSNVVFLLWGKFAASKSKLINQQKHKILISSHPSGLSNTKSMHYNGKLYKSFMDTDHFGAANKYLRKYKKREIIWKI